MIPADYHGGSILNLMSRIGGAFGAPSRHYAPAEIPGDPGLEAARTVVLLMLDGIGDEYLRERPESRLHDHRVGRLTSVFPSTTSAAVTTFMTGLAPRAHGITGWFTYFRELAGVVSPLPFSFRAGSSPISADNPEAVAVLPREAFADRLEGEAHVVHPHFLTDTTYTRATAGTATRHGYKSLDDLVARVAAIARARGPRRYVYAYWPDFDAACHIHGTSSEAAAAAFAAADKAFAALLEAIAGTDTVVIAVSDHGLVDIAEDRRVWVEDHPRLAECLRLPLCGEPRTAFAYVRPGWEGQFRDYVEGELAAACTLHRAGDWVEAGWLGPGPEHPEIHQRVGDFVLVMNDGWLIKDRILGEGPFAQIGVHGGASSTEMNVPLIVAHA